MPTVTPIEDASQTPTVRGFLHTPDTPAESGLVLTHGAGSDAHAPLLCAVAEAFSAARIAVLRCDLPFRQARPRGSPYPATAAQDRAGLASAVHFLKRHVTGKIYLGGQSYGGRQATMLAAEQPDVAAGLLLLSYPLHPPGRRADLRTAHFPKLTIPALFIHGTRDPFGSIEEVSAALPLIPASHEIIAIAGAGHDLGGKKTAARVAATILEAFRKFAIS